MFLKIGKEYFNYSHIESVELTNNDKSIILHTSSGRTFMYDVDEVPGMLDVTIRYLAKVYDGKKNIIWSPNMGLIQDD